ncbi:MAG: monovalent cation/H+ antiporter complex subunit F [Streptosporangiaceae bacterium]
MSTWLIGTVVLLLGGLAPAGWIASRGSPVDRLVGLQMGNIVATLVLVLISQAESEPQYLIVPLVTALLSFAGTLVYTRLLAPRR